MMIIYKYKLIQDAHNVQNLQIPAGGIPLHAGEQFGELYIWYALPKPDEMTYSRRIYVLGTGIDNSHIQLGDVDRLRFLNTVQMSNELVWHVFVV